MKTGFEELKARAEALLYASSKPVELKLLMKVCGLRSRDKMLKILEELREDYRGDGRALELVELPGDRFYLKLRKEYLDFVKKYVKRPLFSRGVMRTLSFIAYHQPIEQSKVAAVRGNSAYKHIKILREKGLVEGEKKGRTIILKTTQLLADYLGVANNPTAIKRAISKLLSREEKNEAEKLVGDSV